jgi:hypothetical protein
VDEPLDALFPDRGRGKSSEEEVDVEKRDVPTPSSEACKAGCSNSLSDVAHAQCLLNRADADGLSPVDGKEAFDGVEAEYEDKGQYCNTKCTSKNPFAGILCELRCFVYCDKDGHSKAAAASAEIEKRSGLEEKHKVYVECVAACMDADSGSPVFGISCPLKCLADSFDVKCLTHSLKITWRTWQAL